MEVPSLGSFNTALIAGSVGCPPVGDMDSVPILPVIRDLIHEGEGTSFLVDGGVHVFGNHVCTVCLGGSIRELRLIFACVEYGVAIGRANSLPFKSPLPLITLSRVFSQPRVISNSAVRN